ncbi:hypothetical protein [Nocardia sp. IFM 10818]
MEIFAKLKVLGTTSELEGPWGVNPVFMSKAVVDLLAALSRKGVAEPEIGVDLGTHYWPVEAVWPDVGVALVEGVDADRDRGLEVDGYQVVGVEETDPDRLAAMLIRA